MEHNLRPISDVESNWIQFKSVLVCTRMNTVSFLFLFVNNFFLVMEFGHVSRKMHIILSSHSFHICGKCTLWIEFPLHIHT
jgi:hypothetical protein